MAGIANTSTFKITTQNVIFVFSGCKNVILPTFNNQNSSMIYVINLDSVNTKNIYNSDNTLFGALFPRSQNTYFINPITGTWYVISTGTIVPGLTPTTALQIDGSNSMAANLNFGNNKGINLTNPTNPSDAVTKSYVDNILVGDLQINGGNSMVANLNFGNNRGINLANPTNSQDAATKYYVDNYVGNPNYLLTNGGNEMLGNLNFNSNKGINLANPVNIGDAVNKLYVDTSDNNDNYLLTSGTNEMMSNLNFNSNKGINILDPTNPQDAATKNYVDISDHNTNYLLTTGTNGMNGSLNFNNNKGINLLNPTNPQDAATKEYVDNNPNYLLTSGTNEMLGNLNFNSNKGINILDPTNPQDAATKNYVDNNPNYLLTSGANEMNGNLNIPSNNVLIGNQVGLPNSSIICIKQTGQLNNVASSSTQGLKFYDSATNTAYYMGYSTTNTLSFFKQAGGSYIRSLDIGGITITIYNQLSMNGNNILNLASPVNNSDAANKLYVDSSTGNTNYLLTNGANGMIGSLNFNSNRGINLANPVNPQDAANKSYVDTSNSNTNYLLISGTNGMIGNLNFNTNNGINLLDPVNPQDAATMNYVDNHVSALVPILISNINMDNNGYWATNGSSAAPSTDYYNAFSVGSNYWAPTTSGVEYLQVISPIPVLVKAVSLIIRGADITDYFNGSLAASNDGINFTTLFTFPLATMQNPGFTLSPFTNNTSYSYFNFNISSTIGNLSNLGVALMQIYGFIVL
jgi:hypothetical protein